MRILSPSLVELHAFLGVVRHGSFRRAADELCVTQAAVSRAVARLESHLGVRLFDRTASGVRLTAAGGELRGQGVKPNGDPWWVALARPASVGAAEGDSDIVALHGVAVATSGVDQKFFAANGRRYSHLLDPRTGQPSAAGLASVSVVAGSCMRADALATAIAVLGPDEGFDFARSRGIAALLLSREGDRLVEAMTPALGAMLE